MDSVYVNAVFTGICSYVIENQQGSTADCVRFVMPNARKWRRSSNSDDVLLPPHQPFLIARAVDVARREEDKKKKQWLGRRPTGQFLDRWVYWILKDETLRFDFGGQKREKGQVKIGNLHEVANLRDLAGGDAAVEDVCLRGRSRRVATRVVFDKGVLTQRSLTTDTFVFKDSKGKALSSPNELVDELQVATHAVPLLKLNKSDGEDGGANDARYLIITPKALDDEDDDPDDDERRARRPIVLSPSQPLVQLYFGSAPEIDLAAVVGGQFNHPHGDANYHFEFHYEVSRGPKERPVPHLFGPGTSGPLAGTDGCPPAHGG